MEGYLAMVTRRAVDPLRERAREGLRRQARHRDHDYGPTAELARAKVEEWHVGDAFSFIHDMDVAADGKFYGTDEGHDKLWVLDPATGEVEAFDLPKSDLPRGGLFSGMHLAIGIFTGNHGPHSMAQTTDGRIWITNALSSTLMSFDPATKTVPDLRGAGRRAVSAHRARGQGRHRLVHDRRVEPDRPLRPEDASR